MSEKSPVELLGVSGEPFGNILAHEMKHRKGLTRAAFEEVRMLRAGITALLESDDPTDIQATEAIELLFRKNDQYSHDKQAHRKHKIGRQGVLHWLAGVSDKDFVAFAKWNVERRQALYEQLQNDRNELIEITLDKTMHLINIGFFPIDALRNIRIATDKYVPFQAMDSFEAGAMHAHGYFDTDVISLANLYMLADDHYGISPQLERTTFHEFMHAGGYLNGTGFHFNDTPLNGRAWEEGFISHSVDVAFSRSSDNPQIDVFDPSERTAPSHSYTLERQLIANLSSKPIADIPIELWARGFFTGPPMRYQQQLAAKLTKGFERIDHRPNSLQLFNDAYEATWDPDDSSARRKVVATMADKALTHLGVTVDTWSEDEPVSDEQVFTLT